MNHLLLVDCLLGRFIFIDFLRIQPWPLSTRWTHARWLGRNACSERKTVGTVKIDGGAKKHQEKTQGPAEAKLAGGEKQCNRAQLLLSSLPFFLAGYTLASQDIDSRSFVVGPKPAEHDPLRSVHPRATEHNMCVAVALRGEKGSRRPCDSPHSVCFLAGERLVAITNGDCPARLPVDDAAYFPVRQAGHSVQAALSFPDFFVEVLEATADDERMMQFMRNGVEVHSVFSPLRFVQLLMISRKAIFDQGRSKDTT